MGRYVVADLILLLVCVSVPSGRTQCEDCELWEYCPDNRTCVYCERCTAEGIGAVEACHGQHDTICAPCPNGTYKGYSFHEYIYRCYECSKCLDNREVLSACDINSDVICGPCPKAMYTAANGRCISCAPCPADTNNVIQYEECRVNGAPQGYYCSPDACPNCTITNTTIDFENRGGFIDSNTVENYVTAPPAPVQAVIISSVTVITIISVATVAIVLLVIYIIGGPWLKWKMQQCFRRTRSGDAESMLLMGGDLSVRHTSLSSISDVESSPLQESQEEEATTAMIEQDL